MTQLLVLIITIVTALACALVGNFLVLRRLSLLGDAMSHSVLPGILLAFLIARSLDSPLFYVFSVGFAILMTLVVERLGRQSVREDSAIGIAFTVFFAIGVILLVQFANDVHIDQHAVLYGEVEFSAFHRLLIAGYDLGPLALWTMGGVLLLNSFIIGLFYKEFKITSFDPAFAGGAGISPRWLHYLLVTLVSLTVVTAFEATGAILVVALLVVPAATAYILSNRLANMIFLSLLLAFLASVLGNVVAWQFNTSIAGTVATMSGLLLFLTAAGHVIHKKYRQAYTQSAHRPVNSK